MTARPTTSTCSRTRRRVLQPSSPLEDRSAHKMGKGSGGAGSTTVRHPARPWLVSPDSPYLRRVSELDDLAVGIAKMLLQSLILIHGAGLLAIPTFINLFDPALRPRLRLWTLGSFSVGL